MKRNQLGNSDLWVSEIGLGCMSLPADRQEAISMIQRAMDLGVNFFDTADLYGRGENERLVGEALQGRRQAVLIATKVGNRWEDGKEGWTWDASPSYIEASVYESLKRLQTDYIDLYQLHGGTLDDDIDGVIDTFEALKRKGLIRAYGISSIRPNVIREYVSKSNIASVMMQYSILDRRPEEAVFDLLSSNGISVIARGPVASGRLSERTLDNVPPTGYLDYEPAEMQEVVRGVHTLNREGRNVPQTAIRYALSRPVVATTVPGASRMSQLETNVQAGDSSPLSRTELEYIGALAKPNRYSQHR